MTQSKVDTLPPDPRDPMERKLFPRNVGIENRESFLLCSFRQAVRTFSLKERTNRQRKQVAPSALLFPPAEKFLALDDLRNHGRDKFFPRRVADFDLFQHVGRT